MNVTHEVIATAVEKGHPSMSFQERRLLQERDYGGLRVAVESHTRRAKSLMWSIPLIALMQTVAHGWIIPARLGSDASVAVRNIGIMGVAFVITSAVVVAVGASRLVKLERARTLLDLYLEGTARYEAVGGEPE